MVITDVLMPGISGPELVAPPAARSPRAPGALCLRLYRGSATSRRLDPPVGLLSKPFTLEALAAATRRALDARQVPQPTSR
jgi:CheY-like chemotaxis protein